MNMLNIGTQKTTVANVTRALNRLGATPKDIIAILQNFKKKLVRYTQIWRL